MNEALSSAIQQSVQATYDDQYRETESRLWRELGAQGKAANIRSVCGAQRFDRLLDVGAGEGAVLAELNDWSQNSEMYAVEISEHALSLLQQRSLSSFKEGRVFDGYEIPFEDKCFDLSILSHVLEHVEFPRQLLREMARVSQYQVIEIPLDYRFDVDKQVDQLTSYGHINVYTPTLLRFLLKTEGFEIVRDKVTPLSNAVKRFMKLQKEGRESEFDGVGNLTWRERWSEAKFRWSSRRRQERKAYTYTVLCRKQGPMKIFHG